MTDELTQLTENLTTATRENAINNLNVEEKNLVIVIL
jgi:hypothetical protein